MDRNSIMDRDDSGYFAANDRERLRVQYEECERLRRVNAELVRALQAIGRLCSYALLLTANTM